MKTLFRSFLGLFFAKSGKYLFVFLLLAPCELFAGEDVSSNPLGSSLQELSLDGVFLNDGDEKVRIISASEEKGQWLMAVEEPGGSDMAYVAELSESVLRPRRFIAQRAYGGAPMRIMGDEERIYGFIDSVERPMAFQYDMERREIILSRDGRPSFGKPSTAEEIELSLLADDAARTWTSMRAASLRYDGHSLVSESSAHLPVHGNRAMVQSNAPAYHRIGDLTEQDHAIVQKFLGQLLQSAAHARVLDQAIREQRERSE